MKKVSKKWTQTTIGIPDMRFCQNKGGKISCLCTFKELCDFGKIKPPLAQLYRLWEENLSWYVKSYAWGNKFSFYLALQNYAERSCPPPWWPNLYIFWPRPPFWENLRRVEKINCKLWRPRVNVPLVDSYSLNIQVEHTHPLFQPGTSCWKTSSKKKWGRSQGVSF